MVMSISCIVSFPAYNAHKTQSFCERLGALQAYVSNQVAASPFTDMQAAFRCTA